MTIPEKDFDSLEWREIFPEELDRLLRGAVILEIGRITDRLTPPLNVVGIYMCLKTLDGRVAVIEIRDAIEEPQSPDTVWLWVAFWEPPPSS